MIEANNDPVDELLPAGRLFGAILVAFGLFPNMSHVAASIPQFVLGGAGILLASIMALLLNAWFNGGATAADVQRDAVRATQGAEHG